MPTICAERHARELGAVFILVGTAVEGGDEHASVEFVGRRAVGRVDQHHGAAGQNVFDMEAAEIAERERQQAEFLRVRYGRAHRERCQRRAYDGVRIGGLLFRDLHVDQRREIVCLHDHKPLAITGLVGGLLADHQSAFAEVELHLLAIVHGDAVFLQHVGRETLFDFRKSRRRLCRDQDGGILGDVFEADEALARHHAGGRHQADPGSDRENRIGGLRRGRQNKPGEGCGDGSSRADGIEFTTVGHAKPVLEPAGAGAAVAASNLFTRRMVRLIRPPSRSKVDVPGSMRSTP